MHLHRQQKGPSNFSRGYTDNGEQSNFEQTWETEQLGYSEVRAMSVCSNLVSRCVCICVPFMSDITVTKYVFKTSSTGIYNVISHFATVAGRKLHT